jgi:hypothetical protein
MSINIRQCKSVRLRGRQRESWFAIAISTGDGCAGRAMNAIYILLNIAPARPEPSFGAERVAVRGI